METEAQKTAPILETAWKRVAILDDMSKRRAAGHYSMRRWIAILGVLATLLAIVTMRTEQTNLLAPWPLLGLILRVLFVATPVLASIVAAIAIRKYSNGDWLVTRAGAEEIQKEIYFFRTILQKKKKRRAYLEKRLGEIQRAIYNGLNGEFSFDEFRGRIPPNYSPDDPTSDPGFADLTGEEYFKYRLENQLNWHNKEINEYRREREWLMILILVSGGLGTVFAAWGDTTAGTSLSIWVALTASITAALVSWQELRNIDVRVRNYSKVVMELTILHDHWVNLEPEERTDAQFYQLVESCEAVLWAQNQEYIRSMQEVLDKNTLDQEASLVNRVIDEARVSARRTKESLQEQLVETSSQVLASGEEIVEETFQGVIGSLAEEASSELVQQELAAMGQAVRETVDTVVDRVTERASAFSDALARVRQDFGDVEISRDTPTEELNTILARYPKTDEVKG